MILRARLALAGAALLPAIAQAAGPADFAIPAGRLDDSIILFARQAGISIGTSDPGIASARGHAVNGRLSIEQALHRLLAGSGYGYVVIDARTLRIVRTAKPGRPTPRETPLTPFPIPADDIVVTATKRRLGLAGYPGTAHVLSLNDADAENGTTTEDIVTRLPAIVSTNLGPGRNKLFVRGLADSSFTGPTQSVVGVYLGDLRLTYNAPDPDLKLYDVGRVEVIEGPQGTLYGAGSLGGIIRLLPNQPDPSRFHGFVSTGVSLTHLGAPSDDFAGMVNLPITSRVALRVVGYHELDGGYIRDVERHLTNINQTVIAGGRGVLRLLPGNGWTVDFGAVIQNINSRDTQYTQRELPPLSRASAIAQPHDNDFAGFYATAAKSWGPLDLVSTTGIVHHDLNFRYDATGLPGTHGVQAFDEANAIDLISQETRLSRRNMRGDGWILGLAVVSDTNRIERSLGPPGAPLALLTGLRNRIFEASLFGEADYPIASRWTLTAGGRIVFTSLIGENIGGPLSSEFEPRRQEFRPLPTIGLAWRPHDGLLAFIRYQTGFRAGGLAILNSTPPTAERFSPDEIHSAEIGARLGGSGHDRLTAAATLSYNHWNNIQADLIDPSGLPFTANVGAGRIWGLELSARYRIGPRLTLGAGVFANDSAITDVVAGQQVRIGANLPNIPKLGAHGEIHYETSLKPGLDLRLGGSLRYVGESKLGITPALDYSQGDYAVLSTDAEIGEKHWRVSLSVTNLLDSRANSFAFGNPFSLMRGDQETPLRPRTVRLGTRLFF